MSLFMEPQRIIPASGSLDAKIVIVGEAPGADEERVGKPFVGRAGGVLETCLHSAQLTKGEVYLTNTIKVRPYKNLIDPYWKERGGFSEKSQEWLDDLRKELWNHPAKIIVALGRIPCSALINRHDITKIRGYLFPCSMKGLESKIVIPAIHPAATLRGNYLWRHYIAHDLAKARKLSVIPNPQIDSSEIAIPTTIEEIDRWTQEILDQQIFAFDIEVANYEMSHISFSWDHSHAVVFSLNPWYWTEQEELHIMRQIARILESSHSTKITQNGIFDRQFLWQKCRIFVRGRCEDTMIAHSLQYPDFEKSLGFLASIHTNRPYWKDMVKFKNIKGES